MNETQTRIKIYSYIKEQINPYGKPFEGTAFEFGEKVMDYIRNMGKQAEWLEVRNIIDELYFKCSECGTVTKRTDLDICPICGCYMRKKVK